MIESFPLYYRFAFNPWDNNVILNTNSDFDTQYHMDIAHEVSQDAIQGYAYRIGNGWRITDMEHKIIEDPYVKGQILDRIKQEEGDEPSHQNKFPTILKDKIGVDDAN